MHVICFYQKNTNDVKRGREAQFMVPAKHAGRVCKHQTLTLAFPHRLEGKYLWVALQMLFQAICPSCGSNTIIPAGACITIFMGLTKHTRYWTLGLGVNCDVQR